MHQNQNQTKNAPPPSLNVAWLYQKCEAQYEQIQQLLRQRQYDLEAIEYLREKVKFLEGKFVEMHGEWQAERAQMQGERELNRLAINALMLRLDRLEHGQREN